jgi:ATP-binding cassette subfamily B protein
MSTAPKLDDYELLERYTDQPARLPVMVRRRAEAALHSAPGRAPPLELAAYGLVDLDSELQFTETWVILTAEALVICPRLGAPKVVQRAQVRAVDTDRTLSCNTLRLTVGTANRPGASSKESCEIVLLRYTQRQRRALENLAALLEGQAALDGEQARDPDLLYASSVAKPIRDAQALVSANQAAVVWRLLGYMKPYRNQVVLGMSAALVITVLSLVPPLITGTLIDDVLGPVQGGEAPTDGLLTAAWLSVAGLSASYILRRSAAWVRLRSMAIIGEYVARDLRTEIYQHLQTLSVSYFSKKKTGSLITRVTSDTDRLWEFLAFGVVDVSLSVVMLLGLSAVLITLDWRLGLVMVLPLPLLVWGIHKNGQRMQQRFVRAWRKWSRVTDVVSDTVPGFRVVKAFDQHRREKRRFDDRNSDVVSEFNAIHQIWTSFWPALMLAVDLTIIAVWVFALPRLLGTSDWLGPPLSLGTFVSFLLYTTMFVAPIEIIGQMARVMNRATTSAHRVFEVLDTEPEVTDRQHPQCLKVEGRVTFENVTFAYDGLRQTLKGISFDVKPGEMIGLVGPSGGGKTTITNLIARFYDVASGAVRIDGQDVRDLDAGKYRRQVGMVLQDPYLFHGSVLENIRYGAPEASVEDVVEAARVANAHDFICKLPHGYDTQVGERGHTLSGGERQRISIARAVLADPKILILDEATSAVDTDTERKIQEAMDRLTKGRTVFAIAHRLSTLRRANRIFAVKEGRVLEEGTHAELLERPNGIYRHLVELQRQMHEAS